MQKSTNKRYPPSSDDTALANLFADFFTGKINKIHQGLVDRKMCVGSSPPDIKVCGTEFCNFTEVTLEEIKKFSRKPLSKSCELDPLPVLVLKGCLTVLLPTIMRIINLSLSTGVVPNALKVATLLPTLKKSDADFEQFQNFRPISNLKVLSKLVEKAVAIQLTDYVMAQFIIGIHCFILHTNVSKLYKEHNKIIKLKHSTNISTDTKLSFSNLQFMC